ncbi:Helix-turn-helix domain-containing protein [Sporobacter termitidis DSM 10068]|uniref:Helix-turn-helix domain-containing protein n=2 Tax=Sporobacter TaxID=44748 RepID=A0A1M5YR20_9FIRM|nr:Helix-turn-helix domain-containing protein [Sporobacter termitidis DSM 10068]
MNHIGNIIKSYRTMLKMSRAAFAENICSEKYVYLIEKGKRVPSVDMTRLFSDKLGVDLFEHYQYLDCENPIAVRDKIKNFNISRRKSDYDTLKTLTDAAIALPDFHHEPWLYEIEVNRFAYIIFEEKKYTEAIIGINSVLRRIKPKYSKGIYVANLYALLIMCYQLTGDAASTRAVTLLANEIIHDKYAIKDYEEIISTVGVGTLAMHYMAGEFDQVIQKGHKLLQYKAEINSSERLDYICFYLAFSYFETGSQENAVVWFRKAIYSLMFEYDPLNVYYMVTNPVFHVLLNDPGINPYLIQEFKDKYDIS